jgi:hypothetical protein
MDVNSITGNAKVVVEVEDIVKPTGCQHLCILCLCVFDCICCCFDNGGTE